MDQRSAGSWRMSVNEKKFIEKAILSDLRVDGRRLFDYRRLTIKFGSEDGSSEVQLGATHVMGYVTSQLVQPYRDRPNEGTLSIFTEFSPMADPTFEAGRPGEFAIELGRVIDRGLRESKAVDLESLCVIAGKSVWALRLDLHVLDNGGNLIDAANIAALAALMTFRRPECTLGENDQDIIIHDPQVREPLPLMIHHLPVAVTFAFFGEGNIMVIDPTYKEEAVMEGRMTATLNSNGDVCAIQKAGEEGVMSSVIMQCLRIASIKAADITSKISNAVDTYNTERALRKVKRYPSSVAHKVTVPDVVIKENKVDEYTRCQTQMIEDEPGSVGDDMGKDSRFHKRGDNNISKSFIGSPSNWDPYSKGTSTSFIRPPSLGPLTVGKGQEGMIIQKMIEPNSEGTTTPSARSSGAVGGSGVDEQMSSAKSLKDAVKLKNKKKNKASSTGAK